MNGQRGDFLAGAAFPEDQHRSVGAAQFANGAEDGLHARADADHTFEGVAGDRLLQLPVFALQLRHVDGPF